MNIEWSTHVTKAHPVLGAAILAALSLSALAPAALAQQAPAAPPAAQGGALPGVVATTNNPNLSVATVRLETGMRASKIIGAAVHNEANERVGSIDDLIMTRDDKVTMAVISVGGFLGLGSKLVVVPWSQLRVDGDKVVMQGATKEGLNAMPNFTFSD